MPWVAEPGTQQSIADLCVKDVKSWHLDENQGSKQFLEFTLELSSEIININTLLIARC